MTLLERIRARIKTDEESHIEQEHLSGWYCGLCSDQETAFASAADVKHDDECPLGLLKEAEAVIAAAEK